MEQITIKKCRKFFSATAPELATQPLCRGVYMAAYSDAKAKTHCIIEAHDATSFVQAYIDNEDNLKPKKKDFFIACMPKDWQFTNEQKILLITKFHLALL